MYATRAAYESAYGADELLQLTDRTGMGDVDSSVFTAAATQADGEVNGYLASRVALPLSSVDPEIVRLALIITRHHLYVSGRPDHVQKDYDQALARLADIRDDRFSLATLTADDSEEVCFSSDERVFARSML